MGAVNIHEAKTHFSRLVDAAASGETVVIARAGRPVAKLVRIEAAERPPRTGFLDGQGSVPVDFNTVGQDEVAALFEGSE